MEGNTDAPILISTERVVDHIRSVTSALLGATTADLDASFGEKYNIHKSVERTINAFSPDPNPHVLFVLKDQVGENEDLHFRYKLDAKFNPSEQTTSALAIIKQQTSLDEQSNLNDQLQATMLPVANHTSSSGYEVLHSMLHFAMAPYFEVLTKTDRDDDQSGGIPSTRRRIAELELALLHLQQNVEIPDLRLSINHDIQRVIDSAEGPYTTDMLPSKLQNDVKFLNSLQANVNSWIKSIQSLTRLDRDPSSGSASQEINFWLSMELTLKNVEDQLASPGVQLTLDVLKDAKRFHATVSFLSDTGIKEATEKVTKFNQLMREFPLDDLISATSLAKIQSVTEAIFAHLNKKLKITPYPVWRALALVEAISNDLNSVLRSLLSKRRIMLLDYDSMNAVMKQADDVFVTWDECFKEFTNIAREMTRKRSEKFIPIRINAKQLKTKERLEYIRSFRTRHEELRRTLDKVLGSQGVESSIAAAEFDGFSPAEEVDRAFDILKDVDALDTSDDGIASWNEAERSYTERTTRVEQAIIAMLRDRLATAKTANEMFRVFSKFNALFVRASIRGAIQEYQTRLIDNVKLDIRALHDRFRQQYANSEAHEMAKLRDIPGIAGTIIWIRQIEHELDNYVQRVEDVLGKGWQEYAEGQKLSLECTAFKKKLNTDIIYEDWLQSVSKKGVSVGGYLFKITKTRGSSAPLYELQVNFNPAVTLLFKEARNLSWLGYQVPHTIASVAKDARRIYPFAVGLIGTLQAHSQIMEIVENNLEISILLRGLVRELYQLIAKGVVLRWESFVHAYNLKAIAADKSSNGESKHVKYVQGLDATVSLLKDRANHLVDLYGQIRKLLDELRTCHYSEENFQRILMRIQEVVDKLNLESYSNVAYFVSDLNTKVKNLLTERCRRAIDSWIASFEDSNKSNELAYPCPVITCELSLRNQVIVLSPSVKQAHAAWLENLQLNIGAVCKVKRLDSERFSVSVSQIKRRSIVRDASLRTFSDILTEVSPEILNAQGVMQNYVSDVSLYLSKWYQFQSLWDLDAVMVYDYLGEDMTKWLQIIAEIRRERSTFDTNDSSKTFGLLKINFKPVQARINSRYDVWQHELVQTFSKRLNARMRVVCSEMESYRRNLEKQTTDSSTTESIVSAVTAVQGCSSNLERWEGDVHTFRSGQTTLSRHRFQFPPKWLFIDQIDNEWAALKEILGRKKRAIDQQIDAIRSKVFAETKRSTASLDALEQRWKEQKPVSGAIDPKIALKTLQKFESEAEDAAATLGRLKAASDALEVEFKPHAGLEPLLEEIRDFNSVWSALDSLWMSLNDLREIAWASVMPRKIRQSLDSFVQTTREMPSRIRQYSAFEHVQNHLKNLLKSNNVLIDLKSEGVRERHWQMLFKELCPNKRPTVQSLTLGDVWDLNLNANFKKIEEIIAIANGELNLENFLKQVREHWTTYALELFSYQNTCRLIKGWDELFQICGENLNSLQAMHHSPYFKVFEEEARQWEDKLNRIHQLFDVWIDVQRQWVYLEGVFNNNGEIKHILPTESSRFQSINSELFVILRKVYKSPLVLDVLNIPGIQASLERLMDSLTRVQKALGEYFEKERQRFARFYFIGDDDLLEIIGNSKDISRTEKHLSKMFAGVAKLIYDEEQSMITGVLSKEGEELILIEPLQLSKDPRTAEWLVALQENIRRSLSESLGRSLGEFNSESDYEGFNSWINSYPCQVNILTTQIWWSNKMKDALLSDDPITELESTITVIRSMLGHLAKSVLNDLDLIERKCNESLITELIHQRDITMFLITSRVTDINDFRWLQQMTFWYDHNAEPASRLTVKQAAASFTYGFEYIGLPDRLVMTPLIDKCFLTMTQALHRKLGGSPFGPAGTGKTEAVKALGHALGKYVLVFCCDEYFDFQAIGRIFLGICQVGGWGCFDEFNRLDERILSALSSQIETIELGLRRFKSEESVEIQLIERNFQLNPGTGIFITMNPGYAGRNALPENLKKLFRSFSMAKPDKEVIVDVLLNSQGYVHALDLAKRVVPLFNELEVQLSKQIHYDFGLRALKSVLSICGVLKRLHVKENIPEGDMKSWEAGIMLQALQETITPKLVQQDLSIMEEIEGQHFKGVKYERTDHEDLRNAIDSIAAENGMVCSPEWLEKALQLYRFQQIHHGIMLVGSPGVGKTSVYKTLLTALQRVEGVDGQLSFIDAKVMSKEALYGSLDSTTREWTDGLFTATLRRVSDNLRGEASKRHWIVFDGDVDPEWIENLNSVLDDNRILTLPNGERLGLPENVRLIFEVENLKYATPATVSRCGMIWFSDSTVTPSMHFYHRVHCLKDSTFEDVDDIKINVLVEAAELIETLFEYDKNALNDLIAQAQSYDHIMEFSFSRALDTFFGLVKGACLRLLEHLSQNTDFPPSANQRRNYLTRSCILGLLWAFSGDCKLDTRHEFGKYLCSLPCFAEVGADVAGELIDNRPSLMNGDWSQWIESVPKVDLDTHAIIKTDVVVPTVDTIRHEELIYSLLHNHLPIILCGPPGSGKTMTLFSALRKSSNLDVVGLNFSKATTPELLIKSMEQYCEYKKGISGITLAPTQIGRWLVVFCDEINLPETDIYGTQRVISLLRQMFEQNGFYNKERQWVTMQNIQFVGACNPPSDAGRSAFSPRFLRQVAVVYVDYPGKVSLHQIYGAFNTAILKTVPSVRGFAKDVTDAMIDFYLQSQAHFTPDVQSHYIYSPRELTRWCRGIYEAISPLESMTAESLLRVWGHEALRLFQDRLVEPHERQWTERLMAQIAGKYFLNTDLHTALQAPILFSNWLTKEYMPVDQQELEAFVKARVKTFNEEELDTDLVLYDDLLDHVLRIDRVMRQPQGHLILIGVSGCGKTTLSRFVAWMNGLKTYQLNTTRKYGQPEFDADLRSVLRRAGCNGEKICFILDESNVLETSFLERMNTLLANGEVPGLFEGDDHVTLMTACKEGSSRLGLSLDTDEELYRWFTGEIVRNLHVIFTMNPPGSDLSSQAAASPALFNRCVLNWMGDWSDKALFQVSTALCGKLNLDMSDFTIPATAKAPSDMLPAPKSYRETVHSAMVYFHKCVVDFEGIATTPGDFLDFIGHFDKIVIEKTEYLEDQQRHFNVGLDKLRETVIKVKELRASLAEKKSQLQEKDQKAKDMLRQMVSDQNEAERKREASIQIQHALDLQEAEIAERQQVVLQDLARAEPAVIEAQQSVGNIKKQQLTELRAMGNPPEAVKLTLESVCTLLGHRTSTWRDIQSFIRRDDFIANIVNFDNERQMTSQLRNTMETAYLSLPNYNYEQVNRASKACGPLLQWVIAQVDYSSILERVGPLRDEVLQLESEANKTKAQATAISDMIEELEESIERYKDDYAQLISETQGIRSEMQTVERKVERSVQLLESLANEKKRWGNSIKEFEARLKSLAGNCLLNAASLAYSGYFDQQGRTQLRYLWSVYLEECGIVYDKNATMSSYLTTAKESLTWQSDGLPNDELCVENAIMVDRYVRYPFIIDPTSRIIDFLKNKHQARALTVTSFLDDAFVKHLESALRFGNPILIQDAEHLDPVVNQILNKEYRKTGGRTLINLGRQEIDFSSEFRMYFLTRDPSLAVAPHVSSRTTIVNFTVTRSSLESQSLNQVLRIERPDIEKQREDSIKLQSEYRVALRQLEEKLLQALSESEGSILENEKVIDTLEQLKVDANHLEQKAVETEKVMETIEEVMDSYRPLARHSGKIFGVLDKLSLLNPFYQFSLEYFLEIFSEVIASPHSSTDVKERVASLVRSLYIETYKRTSLSVLSTDRKSLALIFSALYADYDTDLLANLLTRESRITSDDFETLAATAFSNPAAMGQKIDELFSQKFAESSTSIDEDLHHVAVHQANCEMPIAICVSEGGDPGFRLDILSASSAQKCETVAMGSVESAITADRAISQATQEGTWVILQNVHLSPDWLEGISKRLKTIKPHSSFRLILTMRLKATTVPTTLLRMSRIIMVEPSLGLKSSLLATFTSFASKRIAKPPMERSKLYFLVAFVHAVILERSQYVPLGWSKRYDFNDSDFDGSAFVIDEWVDLLAGSGRTNVAPAALPWDALKGLLSTTIYGGRIDLQQDTRVLLDIIDRTLRVESFNVDFELASGLVGPEGNTVEEINSWIANLPDREPPAWLGLSSTADEAMREIEGKRITTETAKLLACC